MPERVDPRAEQHGRRVQRAAHVDRRRLPGTAELQQEPGHRPQRRAQRQHQPELYRERHRPLRLDGAQPGKAAGGQQPGRPGRGDRAASPGTRRAAARARPHGRLTVTVTSARRSAVMSWSRLGSHAASRPDAAHGLRRRKRPHRPERLPVLDDLPLEPHVRLRRAVDVHHRPHPPRGQPALRRPVVARCSPTTSARGSTRERRRQTAGTRGAGRRGARRRRAERPHPTSTPRSETKQQERPEPLAASQRRRCGPARRGTRGSSSQTQHVRTLDRGCPGRGGRASAKRGSRLR